MKERLHRQASGKLGEEIAREALEKMGYRHLASNFRTREGEIDLVFLDGRVLVLVEVKYRKGKQIQDIEETITREKIKRILKSAEVFISQNNIPFDEMRVDAFFVEEAQDGFHTRHLKSYN